MGLLKFSADEVNKDEASRGVNLQDIVLKIGHVCADNDRILLNRFNHPNIEEQLLNKQQQLQPRHYEQQQLITTRKPNPPQLKQALIHFNWGNIMEILQLDHIPHFPVVIDPDCQIQPVLLDVDMFWW